MYVKEYDKGIFEFKKEYRDIKYTSIVCRILYD